MSRRSISVVALVGALGCTAGAAPAPVPVPPDSPAEEEDTSPKMRAHVIDVGQGAATLYELPCGAVLVDTGGETNAGFDSRERLLRYLDAFFEERPDLGGRLDALVITHAHKDHVSHARAVVDTYAVANVVTNGFSQKRNGNYHSGGREQEKLETWARENARLRTVAVSEIARGGSTDDVVDPVRCNDVDPELTILWGHATTKPAGWSEGAYDEANNHSVTLRIRFGRASFLVTGDLELEGIDAILAKHRGTRALDVDVWQVSHHGSKNGANTQMLEAVTPEIALLGTGAPDRERAFTAWAFGHPRKEIVDLLSAKMRRRRTAVDVQVGTKAKAFERYSLSRAVYATGWDGDVVVTASALGKYQTETHRAPR